ncbi:hypothetical protein IW261DRAFT_1476497 [Armillaria novae-zelandiae]|uniref:C2H2-type domain-containing protein n=1 Tax=Armillaria novae-zelandiae TaxID=153914 RepID=A0AA39UIG3_9AGAR|nr:hypothetical protein IW261DRAFT_1476497 [Armillaria novae-zelandiae]
MSYPYVPEIHIYSPAESDGQYAFDDSPLEILHGFPEIPPGIWDQGIITGAGPEHGPSQYLTSSAGDEGMLFNDGASPYSPYRYDCYPSPSNSVSPPSPNIPLLTPEDAPYHPLPPYSLDQFQGSVLLGNSFQSLYTSEQPSSPSSFITQPYDYSQPPLSAFQNTLPAEFDRLCLLSPLSATESVALSPSPTASVSSLPDEEENVGGGLDSLAGKRCTLPPNAKRNLRSLEHPVVGQHRKKISTAKKERAANGSEAKRIREQKYKCTFVGCKKTYTASHNFKDHLKSHAGMRLLCSHRDSGCREDYAQEVSLSRHHRTAHKDCTERHHRADYVWASKEECQ